MLDIADLVQPDKGLINPSIYTDPEIYQAELANVFARSWLFLAHDSQLPKKGSFLQTYMAEDPVLVVRQRDGSVKAFLNAAPEMSWAGRRELAAAANATAVSERFRD